MSRRTRSHEPGKSHRRPRRLPWILLALLLTLGLVGWLSPMIVAGTSWRQSILPTILPQANAEFTLGSASVGWLSPVSLSDIKATGEDGEVLLTIDSLVTDKTLWELLRERSDVGKLTINGATLHADVREDGSNLEDAFASLLDADEGSSPIQLEAAIRNSEIHVRDIATGRESRIENVQAEFKLAPQEDAPIQAKVGGEVTEDSVKGSVSIAYVYNEKQGGGQGDVASGNQIIVQSADAPLAPFACLARRLMGPLDVGGRLTSHLTIQSTSLNNGADWNIVGQAHCQKLQLAAPAWLGDDVFMSDVVRYTGNVTLQPERIIASDTQMELDHGQLLVNGSIPRSLTGNASLREALQMLAREDVQASGRIDLARLARALPRTLRIREDTTITGGDVTFMLNSRSQQGQRAWTLQMASSNITAQSAGLAVAWNQPIDLYLGAHQATTGLVVDQLLCQSDFMQITGQGDLRDATISAKADLNVLAQQLGQFIDLRNVALAGKGDFQLRLLRDADTGRINMRGDGKLEQVQLAVPKTITLDEKLVTVNLIGALVAPQGMEVIGAEQATLTIAAGDDLFSAQLSQPVMFNVKNGRLPLNVQTRGDLNRWAARLGGLLPLDGWSLKGDVALSANAEVSTDAVRIIASQCDFSNLEALGHGHYLREQKAQLTATGQWAPQMQQIDATLVTVATQGWSLRGDDVTVRLKPTGLPDVQGRFAFRSDIRATLAAFRPARERPQTGIRGMAAGNVALSLVDGVTRADVTSQIENLVLESSSQSNHAGGAIVRPAAASQAMTTVWTERQLKLGGRLVYDHNRDGLQIDHLEAETTGTKLTCAGTLHALTTSPVANISGEATYNLAALMHRFGGVFGREVQLLGADTGTFSIQGPLSARASTAASAVSDASNTPVDAGQNSQAVATELQAAAGFAWESAEVYGLPVGAGEMQAILRHGIVDFKPMSLAVSEGTLNLTPRIYLNDSPQVMTLDRGQVLDNVELTPQLSRGWLKYVAPLLADATQCQGRVSAQIDWAVFPLSAPATGNLSGTLTIHGADVRAGPLAGSYIHLVRRVQNVLQGQPPEADALGAPIRLVRLEEQDLIVNMVDGRVHHEGLTMKIGDVSVVTSGSVGADQSLELIAAIAVKDEWIEGRSYLIGLQGQSLNVPIRGTVSRPQIDFSILEDLGRKTLTGAAARIFRREINGLLGDLLAPPQENEQPSDAPPIPELTPPSVTPPTLTPPPLTPPRVEIPSGSGTRG